VGFREAPGEVVCYVSLGRETKVFLGLPEDTKGKTGEPSKGRSVKAF